MFLKYQFGERWVVEQCASVEYERIPLINIRREAVTSGAEAAAIHEAIRAKAGDAFLHIADPGRSNSALIVTPQGEVPRVMYGAAFLLNDQGGTIERL